MRAVIGDRPEHYERLGITPGVIQPWEDGLRTGGAEGTWEWWYCDAHLEDGSTLTVEFHTKPPYVSPKSPLTPFVLLTLTLPDGTRIDKMCTEEPGAFRASTHGCDVKIGAGTFKGGPEDGYTVHVEIDDVVADITLTPEAPPWRPETGHVFFGENEEHYIAWLPVATRNAADVTLVRGGRTERLTGVGYHDHNWGNVAPRKVLDHWYWGRACVGDYTVVTLMFVTNEAYDKAEMPAFLVAESGKVLASAVGPDSLTFSEDDMVVNEQSGVPVAKRLTYRTGPESASYAVTFQHRKDAFLLDLGNAGAYHRFIGDVTVEHTHAGRTDIARGRTLWELLHFGPRAAKGTGAFRDAAGPAL
ncbi:hydroxyneurosporene dehydrogenase [Streptomyces glomeratus]|uniref:AsqO/PenF-like C-terminal domain-containing protein n=1 Tax=Streptomyces glomeratus TaxID=284452 RepID=A0ABP6LK03_9ACTN|nr:hydroxyneurosporene dehydrogenase [Streptomyces glomeratus]MCF1508684.1 hydroxyneurosporene dehydrogenase [Streptomyces glomeratus]